MRWSKLAPAIFLDADCPDGKPSIDRPPTHRSASPVLPIPPSNSEPTKKSEKMFSWLRPRAPAPPPKPFDFANNRFPAHTVWPPAFDDLTEKERFALEKRFR